MKVMVYKMDDPSNVYIKLKQATDGVEIVACDGNNSSIDTLAVITHRGTLMPIKELNPRLKTLGFQFDAKDTIKIDTPGT